MVLRCLLRSPRLAVQPRVFLFDFRLPRIYSKSLRYSLTIEYYFVLGGSDLNVLIIHYFSKFVKIYSFRILLKIHCNSVTKFLRHSDSLLRPLKNSPVPSHGGVSFAFIAPSPSSRGADDVYVGVDLQFQRRLEGRSVQFGQPVAGAVEVA